MDRLSFNKLKNKAIKIVWREPFSGSLFKSFITNINPLLVYCIGLKEIGWNAYSNYQPTWTLSDIISYELSSSNSYSMAGRTMVHQINTPKKYSVIHANGGGGLFASYNRSIPK